MRQKPHGGSVNFKYYDIHIVKQSEKKQFLNYKLMNEFRDGRINLLSMVLA